MTKKTRNRLLILTIVVAVIAAIIAGLANFYTEYLWFAHLGFSTVYVTVLVSQVGTGVAFGLVCFAMLMVHIMLIKKYSKPREDWRVTTASGDEIDLRDIVSKVSTPVVVAAALVVASGMGYWASMRWEDVLKYLNSTDFGQAEPILAKDIGFYLFSLPVMQFAQQWLVYLAGLCLVLSGVVYFLRNAITVKGKEAEMSAQVRKHLLFGVGCVMLVLAWGWRLEMFATLYSKRGVAYGATFTDVYANLWAYRILIVACVACALYLFAQLFSKAEGFKKTIIYPGIAIGIVLGLFLLGTFAWPYVVQEFIVKPNELAKEKEYLEHAIRGTRTAYNLDKIEVREFPAKGELTYEDIKEASATIDNIKIWDHRPLKLTYKQLQELRPYYDFPTISVDRYWSKGRYWQVMLAARELLLNKLPTNSQTWVNRHLQYTHGYGVCLSPVNSIVGEGLPDLWIKDIPPQSGDRTELKVTRPEVYYGQETNEYVLVKTKTQEIDYPKGFKEVVYTTYQGKGGVGIGGFFMRMLFAIRMQDVNLLFTTQLKEESKILFNRHIQQRLDAVAPFLMQDQEPYMSVVKGRLKWIQDAYTMSYRFPYSQPTSLAARKNINYIRNSVKVVIDAFDGDMQLFVWDEKDPMIQTYRKMFPALFLSRDKMPKELVAHVRYPKDMFAIQSEMYESFHMTNPRIYYNQEDKWAVSRELSEKTVGRQAEQRSQPGVTAQQVTQRSRMAPYYMIMKLPQEKKEEFLLMVPYTPTNKDNMVAWMTARCDGNKYGQLVVYTFPKEKLIFGPMQVEARIDQDKDISKDLSLWNQQGSQVIRGDLLVIPIKESVLYVEPIYLEATQTQLPELKKIIVAFGNKLSMKNNLQAALYEVFGVKMARPGKPGSSASTVPVGVPDEAKKVLSEARSYYVDGQKAVAKGDWAAYGKKQQALKRALDRLADLLQGKLKPKGAPPAPAPAPKTEAAPAPAPAPAPTPKTAPAPTPRTPGPAPAPAR